jgi:hypothetical protein
MFAERHIVKLPSIKASKFSVVILLGHIYFKSLIITHITYC